MPTGYTFKGKGATKDRRLAVHKNAVHEQGGKMTGYNVGLFVAQDKDSGFEPQTDTRVQYDVYDADLAKQTNNQKGVDNTIGFSKDQWEKVMSVADTSTDHIVFDSPVFFTEKGAMPNTKEVSAPKDGPFDKEAHDKATQAAREAKASAKEAENGTEKENEDLEP